jgi:hypothetical protein
VHPTRAQRCAALVIGLGVSLTAAFGGVSAAAGQAACRRGTFHDYHDQGKPGTPPASYKGPTFKLSQSYPESLPPLDDEPWAQVDAAAMLAGDKPAAAAYLQAMRDYAFQGNIAVDWVVQKNTRRNWYHLPWLDTSADGREFVHGLTHELDSVPPALGPSQTKIEQTWAIGFYNAPGAYAVGQVWCQPNAPAPSALNGNGNAPNAFPNGTAVVKLLFTTADDTQAPFLRNTFEWTADIFKQPTGLNPNNPANIGDPPRKLGTVRLIQVDLAVRDDRLPNGWAFGTYAYDGSVKGATPWDRLVPVGLQWGNDPGVTPAAVSDGAVLHEQWINTAPSVASLVDNHLGWAGRLVGPLDNPNSSCMSCHQTAGSPGAPLVPEAAPGLTSPTQQLASTDRRLGWFTNVPAGIPFQPGQVSLDYSLQLAIGLQRFYVARCLPQALNEQESARGPARPSPELVARETCKNLAIGSPESSSGGTSHNWWWIIAIAVVLDVVIVLIIDYLYRRKAVT